MFVHRGFFENFDCRTKWSPLTWWIHVSFSAHLQGPLFETVCCYLALSQRPYPAILLSEFCLMKRFSHEHTFLVVYLQRIRTWKNMILLSRRAYRISAIGTFSTQLTFPGFTDGTGTFARSGQLFGELDSRKECQPPPVSHFKGFWIDMVHNTVYACVYMYPFRYQSFHLFSKKHT